MIKVLAMIPNKNDGTSAYRAAGPLLALERSDDIDLTYGEEPISFYDWSELRRCDLFFSQRPCLPVHSHAIQKAKEVGLPVWIDLDDDLLGVPNDNPAYRIYSDPTNRAALINCLQMADVVTVSTPELQSVIAEYCLNVRVVPNAYDDLAYPSEPVRALKRNKIIAWRGGDSHQEDLRTVAEDILTVARSHPDWKWAFMGYDPKFITNHMDKGQFRAFDFTSSAEYMRQILGLSHAIHIVPLNDHRFNRCKSNIAWIEASYAGARTLSPDWEEWKRPGVINYGESAPFLAQLETLIQNQDTLTRDDFSWTAVMETLTLSRINLMRVDILQSLLK